MLLLPALFFVALWLPMLVWYLLGGPPEMAGLTNVAYTLTVLVTAVPLSRLSERTLKDLMAGLTLTLASPLIFLANVGWLSQQARIAALLVMIVLLVMTWRRKRKVGLKYYNRATFLAAVFSILVFLGTGPIGPRGAWRAPASVAAVLLGFGLANLIRTTRTEDGLTEKVPTQEIRPLATPRTAHSGALEELLEGARLVSPRERGELPERFTLDSVTGTVIWTDDSVQFDLDGTIIPVKLYSAWWSRGEELEPKPATEQAERILDGFRSALRGSDVLTFAPSLSGDYALSIKTPEISAGHGTLEQSYVLTVAPSIGQARLIVIIEVDSCR